jgi:uncharacterized protein YuzE
MRLQFDEHADALYLRLDDSEIVESEEVRPGVDLDLNAEDQVVGVELLNVRGRIPLDALRTLEFRGA